MIGYLLFALNILLQWSGQILLKTGVNAANGNWSKAVFNPYTIAGGALLATNLLVWLAVLRYFKLSYIYPMGALLYILTAIGGIIFLSEHLNPMQWVGIGLIVMGVAALNVPLR